MARSGLILYRAPGAPNPRRVTMFIAEKGLHDIELVDVDLNAREHYGDAYRRISPLSKVPALVLPDGRALTESRAICSYLEHLFPEPNLMGSDAAERAFIEMADRRVELELMLAIVNCVRHTHPGLAVLEPNQFAAFGQSQADKVRALAAWYDDDLSRHPWIAGERFTVADITAFCAIEFAKLMRFQPGREGFVALQAWRDRVAERASAQAR